MASVVVHEFVKSEPVMVGVSIIVRERFHKTDTILGTLVGELKKARGLVKVDKHV